MSVSKALLLVLACLLAQKMRAADPSLTIYNQNFAVVRDTVPLDLKSGTNQVRFIGATAHLEPSSVLLRDPAGQHAFQILEQNYRGDPLSQGALLQLNEGKTIEFETSDPGMSQSARRIISGKIIRSGERSPFYGGGPQPIIQVDGKLRFEMPGLPIFPALGDDYILQPTLEWVIESDETARFDAEISYLTSEMTWEADYNLVLPESGNQVELAGWVTVHNNSGKSFEHARIKLMAGDVNKIPIQGRQQAYGAGGGGGGPPKPAVTEKSFDEYHLYTLERATTLWDQETKQVEFVRAAGIRSTPLYIYDGASENSGQVWRSDGVETRPEYGFFGNRKVWVMREFTNSVANHLGLPLPKGRMRFYRQNTDGQMEFTGEDVLEHTPRDEVIRLFTGSAFDIVGERKRTDIKINFASGIDPTTGLPNAALQKSPPFIDESFEITVRNHKEEAVEIRVVEHPYRWTNWDIREKSDPFTKTDTQTIEFRLPLKSGEERKITYTVHYSW